jgi:hypothetical protein
MRNIHNYLLLCILSCGLSIQAAAEDITVIKADRVETVTAGLIENGIILIQDGRIKAIGNDIEIPENADIIDVSDKTVFPGLVNPASRIGLSASPRGAPASNPHYRVADELYPHQDAYKRILRAGFTTVGLVPGGTGVTGQGAIVRPIGCKPDEMIITESEFLAIGFQANDRNKKVIKDALESAKSKTSSTDPKVRPLVNALQGKTPTFLTCGRPGEMLHLMKLLKPYGKMKLVLIAGSEKYRIAKQLADRKIPVVLPARIDFEPSTRNRINVPAMLADAGVKIAIKPRSDSIQGHEDFLRQIAELVKSGLDPEIAKKAITIHPAEMLAVDYRLGSLEVGKDANLLILTGDPLEVGTGIHMVMVEGKIVYKAP